MISHLNQYIVDKMTHSCKIVCIFMLCMVRYIFFGIKLMSRLIGLIHENIAKMANKIFNAPNHLNLLIMTLMLNGAKNRAILSSFPAVKSTQGNIEMPLHISDDNTLIAK